MSDYIDIYCERIEPGLLAEPVNAMTNIAFFIAAFFAYRLAKEKFAVNTQTRILIVLLCAIGAGSTMFHTLATSSAQRADVLPIVLYQIAFIVFYSTYVIKLDAYKTSLLFVLFMGSSVAFDRVPAEILNGSAGYIPALCFLSGFAMWQARHVSVESKTLLYAALTFIASLSFRTMDMAVCSDFPLGTHFLWHLLNGVVLYLTTRAYILNQDKSAKT